MNEISVKEYVLHQEELEKEANKLMPYDPSQCTYSMGPLRQQIYACLSCNNIGVCYSCSIQCHTSCDLVELFDKRDFSCDCGTERQKTSVFKPCTLRKNTTPDIADLSNRYGQNFKGKFCSCHTEYDPNSTSTMVQCILGLECNEDWYHDYCILGLDKNPDIVTADRELPGFPSLDTFDTFVCWLCVEKYHSYFQRLLSHELSEKAFACQVYRDGAKQKENFKPDELVNSGGKRAHEEDSVSPFSVFLREGYKEIFSEIKEDLPAEDSLRLFLSRTAPFLTEEEKIYEPPKDEGTTSMVELGNKAMASTLSHQQTVEGLVAFEQIKTKLTDFLRPFAENGKVVSELDIKTFFDKQKK